MYAFMNGHKQCRMTSFINEVDMATMDQEGVEKYAPKEIER
jgi:hypothetical protein